MTVLKKLHDADLTLYKDKCEFNTTSIKVWDKLLIEMVWKQTLLKFKWYLSWKLQKNLKNFTAYYVWMTNQLSKFLPNLAEKTKPVRYLLKYKKPVDMGWSTRTSFYKAQTVFMFQSDPSTLQFLAENYCFNWLLSLWTGCCTQTMPCRPMAYVSRLLTENERRYTQIEKEALAVMLVCERF